MSNACYRIESNQPLMGRLLPPSAFVRLYGDRAMAIALAVKGVLDPTRYEVRVVHVPTGKVVFRTGKMGGPPPVGQVPDLE